MRMPTMMRPISNQCLYLACLLLPISQTATSYISSSSTLLRSARHQPSPIVACVGCLQSIEPWGDVLGDNPIARKSSSLKQIGNGGGDPTPSQNNAPLNEQFRSSESPYETTTSYSSDSGKIQPGPNPTKKHEIVIHDETTKNIVTNRLTNHNQMGEQMSGKMNGDTLDNKCFYCEECTEIFGQKCYMKENQYNIKYVDGVCLGLSFLWVKASSWDTFIETLSTNEGKNIIQNIMDGQEEYMKKTTFPPNYAKGLMTELYHIPTEQIEVEMVELSGDHPKNTFEEFMLRAIHGTTTSLSASSNVDPCIVIVFSKSHAMAIRVVSATKIHFFDPNYGQFGMGTVNGFLDRLWEFVQPPSAVEGNNNSGSNDGKSNDGMPAYGNVWAYVRHVDQGENEYVRQQQETASSPLLRSENELGNMGDHMNTMKEKDIQSLPFVPTNARELPMGTTTDDGES
jgi:hypothetical protein